MFTTPVLIIATQVFQGLTWGVFQPASRMQFKDLAATKGLNTALGLRSAMTGTGMAVGVAMTGTLLEISGRVLFGTAAIAAATSIPLAMKRSLHR
jgi:MFS family permease